MCSRTHDLIAFGMVTDEPHNILDDLSWYTKPRLSVHTENKIFDENMKRLENELRITYLFEHVFDLFTQAGLRFRTYNWMYSFLIEKNDLPKVYKLVGKLELSDKSVKNAKLGLINVTLTCAKYPGLQFIYDTFLSPTDKCKIVANYIQSERLVCSK